MPYHFFPADALHAALVEDAFEEGMTFLDPNGKILSANQKILALLDVYDTELVGKDFFDAIPLWANVEGDAITPTSHPVQRMFDTGITQMLPFFCFYHTKHDTMMPMVLKSIPVKDLETGEVLGGVVKLRKAERMFNVKDMQSSLVSMAAHQIKTPAGVSQGYLELALALSEKQAIPERMKSYLLSAYEANLNLCRVAKDLLNATKLEGGIIQPEVMSMDFVKLFEQRKHSYEQWAKTKNITITFETQTPEFVAQTDPNLATEIFDILLHNALKFVFPGGNVKVNAVWLPHTKNVLEVSVEDDGPGMGGLEKEADMNNQMFNKTSHGMGLRLATQYAALLKGNLTHSPVQPHGTKFVLRLPSWT